MNIINLKNISKNYGKGDGLTKALKNINLEIEKGDMVAILGKSGSGKSTLLNILACMDVQTTGEFFLENSKVNFCNYKETAKIRNKKIGLVFQSFNLIPDITVEENIMLPINYSKYKKKFYKNTLNTLLRELNIEKLKNKIADNLSGGEKQRVAIARALINNPDIILADEPTGALDETHSKMVIDILKRINDQGHTVIIVTHDNQIANECKRTIVLEDGLIKHKT